MLMDPGCLSDVYFQSAKLAIGRHESGSTT